MFIDLIMFIDIIMLIDVIVFFDLIMFIGLIIGYEFLRVKNNSYKSCLGMFLGR